jgi:hypothetical protein
VEWGNRGSNGDNGSIINTPDVERERMLHTLHNV